MAASSSRQGIFLSHATPGDNAFVLWLGVKLSALGYDVWADIFRLKGGDDWERLLEDAIRNKAAKFLVAANPQSVERQGVRNEIKIAVETGKKIGDDSFIVPLRMADYQSPYLVIYAQWIDFKESWAVGLKSLVETLEASGVPRPGTTERTAFWAELQLGQSRALTVGPEELRSNWLPVKRLPQEVSVYDFAAGIFLGAKESAIRNCPIPLVAYGRGFLSFAPQQQLQDFFGEALPLRRVGVLDSAEYADKGSNLMKVSPIDARRHLVDLMRRAIEWHLARKGLQHTELANERRMWWAEKGLMGLDRKAFAWADGPSGRRQLVGQSKARNVFWHYGVSCWPATSPLHHIRLSGHVIFTVDGRNPVGDARRMHKMRRTLCRSWRNDRWRDLLLGFLYWLNDGETELRVSMGDGADMLITLPTMAFDADFGLAPTDGAAGGEGGIVEGTDDATLDAGDDDDPLSVSSETYDEDDDDDGEVADSDEDLA